MDNQFDLLRERLRSEKKRLGAKSLAQMAGLSEAMINSLSSGERRFTEKTLDLVSRALGKPVADLLKIPQPEDVMLNDKEVRECLELMTLLPKFKYGILEKANELKARYQDEITELKKERAAQLSTDPAGWSARTPSR